MPEKPPAKSTRPKAMTSATAKKRRDEVRRLMAPPKAPRLQRILQSPELVPVGLTTLLFIIVTSAIIAGFRDRLLPAPDRTASETRAVRVDFEVEDPKGTDRKRERARNAAAPVYVLDDELVARLAASMQTLPDALLAAESFDQVSQELVDQYGLTPESFAALRAFAPAQTPEPAEGETSGAVGDGPRALWEQRVERFVERLTRLPLLSLDDYQRTRTAAYNQLLLIAGEEPLGPVGKELALPISVQQTGLDERLRDALRRVAREAGVNTVNIPVFVQRVIAEGRPVYLLDPEATAAAREAAVAAVGPDLRAYSEGELLYVEGERVTPEQYAVAQQENQQFLASRSTLDTLTSWLGIVGIVTIIAAAVGGYIHFFYRSLLSNWWRLAALAGMIAGATFLSAWLAVRAPTLLWASALTPTLFVGMIAVVAYDRRLAMLVGAAQMLLVGLTLDLGVGYLTAGLVGIMLAAWRLANIRNRNDVVRGGLVATAGLALGVLVVGFFERPVTTSVALEVLTDAATSGAGAFLASALLLVSLPTVERTFDITTGMTLAELRDPKHPLLRQLQQRAPGTYNHSLNVATLAETAAESIGADGLHVYVGAVYHDIGKMNKPDYFVENQPRGFNKHDKLSPAMSLLVIVGHVKDGLELAREYSLPKSLHHYVESHHGTTLVEYFYDQARRQADEDDNVERPAEIEYRYPGPKPQTKEAALLMLCDAVESAARAMGDPTPARIDTLVRELARKRLADGQFDECGLTLREVSIVSRAITRALSSIYHGRIAYPTKQAEGKGSSEQRSGEPASDRETAAREAAG